MENNKIDKIIVWFTGEAFATSILLFSVDLLKALLLGVVGGLGGLLAHWLWKKFETK